MKNNKILVILWCVISVSFIMGCSLEDYNTFNGTLTGNGNVISQERNITDFNGIVSDAAGNVNIYPAENFRVVVTTDSNLQDVVNLWITGNTLYINNVFPAGYSRFRASSAMRIDVYLPELENIDLSGVGNIRINNHVISDIAINLSGAGNIDVQNIEAANIAINLSGVGNIDVHNIQAANVTAGLSGSGSIRINNGNVSGINMNLNGVGNINAQNIETENAVVNMTGAGDIRTWAVKTLTGTITGVGTVWYKGNPAITVTRTSIAGNLRRL